jgi:hypothetical protein
MRERGPLTASTILNYYFPRQFSNVINFSNKALGVHGSPWTYLKCGVSIILCNAPSSDMPFKRKATSDAARQPSKIAKHAEPSDGEELFSSP